MNSVKAQKIIYVKDSLSRELLKDVQIIVDDKVYFTNDDGVVLLPKSDSVIKISNSFYKSKVINTIKDTVFLNPIYKEIEEVVITNNKIDFASVIDKVFKDFKKNYYCDDSVFLINLKQKGIIDYKINNIFIADLNIWTLHTFYDYSKKEFNDFLQINVNDIKHSKSGINNSRFNDLQLRPADFVYNLFMNAKLTQIIHDVYNNNAKVKSKIIYEDKDFQKISFSYVTNEGVANGFILYSKSDNVITNLELNYDITNLSSNEKTNKNGEKYNTITKKNTVSYNYYKKNGKYYPARLLIKISGENIIKNENHPFSFEQSIIYNQQKKSNKKGLNNKIDLSKVLSDNIPTKEVKTNKTILSKEEQKFVDEP